MNEQLLKLYSSKWDNLSSAINRIIEDEDLDIKPANPLLIHIDSEEDWKNADIRLMFFGQETNRWCGEWSDESNPGRPGMDYVQGIYDVFFNKEGCWSYGGQFWNGVSRFIKLLHEKYPDKKISLIWNNIVKIGKENDKGLPPDYIYEVEREHFSIIKDELEITKPNIVLFLTGPNYDNIIKDNLGQVEFLAGTPYPERQISRIFIDEIPFAFRTYHPNYLWRNDIDDFFNAIINQINL